MDSPQLPYHELFASNPLPMWVYDVETLAFLVVNDAAVSRYGWTREEFLAMTIRDIRPAEDLQRLETSLTGGLKTKSRSGIWRHRTKSGEMLLVDVSSFTFPYEGRAARLVIGFDVTAQELARQSDERFRLVARATTDAIWDWDLVTNALWWNDGMAHLFGEPALQATNTAEDWKRRLHPDDAERVISGIEATLRGSGGEWTDEYRYRRADGSYAIVQDRGFVLRDAEGKPLRMVGGMSDLTERREMEARVLRAQRMEGIGTLAGGIAHDLNNMLTPILMSIDLLRAHVATTEGQEVLTTIEASAKRGADLVRQVLTYARGVDGQREPLAVATIVRDLTRMLGDTIPKDIRLEKDVPEGIWGLVGDATQMQQVFMNLLVNARDAMPAGGSITVRAANVIFSQHDALLIFDARPGQFVRISVTDEGTGMSSRVCERIFEPFFTTKGVGQGTGLGLSTVQAIVRSHGGFVTVRSEPGKGTTFDVHLPADLRPAAGAAPPRRVTPVLGIGQLLLVVDDEPHIRQFAAKLLERKGFRVIGAGGGTEALEQFNAHLHECMLVLTDMQMPGGDGRTVIRGVRRISPAMPIIAMSGLELSEPAPGDADQEMRGVLHLLKPFSADQLDTAVRRALSQR